MDYAERLQRIYNGQAWHGPTTVEVLAGVTATEATSKPQGIYHSIAELVSHMIAWRDFAMHMIERDYNYRIELNSSVDWPVINVIDEEGWIALKAQLELNTGELVRMFGSLTQDQLDEQLGERPFSLRVVVEGVIDHDLYHCGQIAYVKKFVRQ